MASIKELKDKFKAIGLIADDLAVEQNNLYTRITDLRRGLQNIVDSGVNPGATIARCLLKQDDEAL